MADIRFSGASKKFGAYEVISNLDLEIRDGEFMVLVGPSGCAKSTTLRMIAGLEAVSGGDLFIGDVRANNLRPKDRNVAMVFQSYALFPTMTVAENLAFGMSIRKEPKDKIRAEVDRVADVLGLGPLMNRKPAELSGGQAQRVALGRAMIRRPDAYLFDEPLSNLDAELRVQMRGEISRLQRKLKVTTVYVTHDQVEAMTMGDRVAVMCEGRVMQIAEPLKLYEDPDNLFTAGFIGSPKMNFLDAHDLCAHFGAEQSVLIRAPKAPGELTAGIRPENALMETGGGAPAGVRMTGMLSHSEALGHETLHYIRPDKVEGAMLCVRQGGGAARVQQGEKCAIVLPYEHLFLFEAADGQRLRG